MHHIAMFLFFCEISSHPFSFNNRNVLIFILRQKNYNTMFSIFFHKYLIPDNFYFLVYRIIIFKALHNTRWQKICQNDGHMALIITFYT